MTKNKINIALLFMAAGIFIFLGKALAMDELLWTIPLPKDTSVLWKDKDAEINGIAVRATHIRSAASPKEIIGFYKDYMGGQDWKVKDFFENQNIIAFSHKDRFFYVAIQDSGPGLPSDAFLVSSPGDLAICRMITSCLSADGKMEKDAGGKDLPDVARYPGSKRMVSIFTPDDGGVLMYDADARSGEIADYFQKQLKGSAWHLAMRINPNTLMHFTPKKEMDVTILVFEKDEDSLVIIASPLPSQPKSKRSMIAMVKNMFDELYSPATAAKEEE